jgi:uracil-DNA glycosylase
MLRSDLQAMLGTWHSKLPTAWRPRFDGIELDFDAVAPSLPGGAIWPAHFFRAFHDLDPVRVRAVIFGNDPYTRVEQATGRAFEQGDITDWQAQIQTGRVTPSLRSLVQAAVLTKFPLVPRLDIVPRIASGAITLPAPPDLFPGWGTQGVLWLNRTLTFSLWDGAVRDAHRRLWAPFTSRVIQILVGEATSRAVAFVLWGDTAQQLETPILHARDALGAGQVRIVKAGHPEVAAAYFSAGNPLEAINAAIGLPDVRWL